MNILHVKIDAELKRALEQKAAKERRTLSETVRIALERAVHGPGRPKAA